MRLANCKSITVADLALKLAQKNGDKQSEGMVLAGKGCALASSNSESMIREALECYQVSKDIAASQRLSAQAAFMESLIQGAYDALRKLDKQKKCPGSRPSSPTNSPTSAATPRATSSKQQADGRKGDAGGERKGDAGGEREGPDKEVPQSALPQPKDDAAGAAPLAAPCTTQQQLFWELSLLASSRVQEEKVSRVVMWELTAHTVLELLLERPSPPPKDFETAVICYTREQSLKVSHKAAQLLALTSEEVSTRVAKTTTSAYDVAATIYVRTESLVKRIHARFDTTSTGFLAYHECRALLDKIRALDRNDYTCFCDSVGATPSEGIDRSTLLSFYESCDETSLRDEFALISAHFMQPVESHDGQTAAPLTQAEMVAKIYEEFDADEDGRLSFEEFSRLLNSMCILTYEQYNVLCKNLGMEPELGLSVSALTQWYEQEASLDQLHADYEKVILLLGAPLAHQRQAPAAAAPAHAQPPGRTCADDCAQCVTAKVRALMESEQYQACVELLSDLLERQDRQSVDSPSSAQARSKHAALPCQLSPPAAKAARAKPDGETACQKSFLQVARGNALFKLSRYQQALSDFDAALHGSLCGVSPELQRRMRICRQAVKRQRRKGKAKVSDAEPAEPLADTVQGSVPADGDDRAEEQEQEPLFEDLLSDYKAEEALITSTKRSRRKKRRQRRCGKGGEGAGSN